MVINSGFPTVNLGNDRNSDCLSMYNVFNVLSLLWKHNTFLFVYCTLFNNIYLGIYLQKNNKTNKQTKQTKNGTKERKKVKKEGFEAALEPSTFG